MDDLGQGPLFAQSAGQMLRAARERITLSVTGLSNRAGCTTTRIQELEAGLHPVTMSFMELCGVADAAFPRSQDEAARLSFLFRYQAEDLESQLAAADDEKRNAFLESFGSLVDRHTARKQARDAARLQEPPDDDAVQ